MSNIKNMGDFIAVKEGSGEILGKVLYYSLSSVLVDKDELREICGTISFPYQESRREPLADAFKSATGDIYASESKHGNSYKVYCRDNETTPELISRELVKETVNAKTNDYKKLANIRFYKESKGFSYDNIVYDEHVNAYDFCQQAEELFELYQRCVGRKQVESILEAYIDSMEAVKIVGHGKIYFVPSGHMGRLQLFEDFIDLLAKHNMRKNQHRAPLDANSMFVIDDAKQRDKMAGAFYRAVQKDIETYQERMNYFIASGSQSPAVMERWILKADALARKKTYYEDILKRELNELNDEFDSLRYLSDELRIRAHGARFRSSAA